MTNDAKYEAEQLRLLVGASIIDVSLDETGEFFCLVVQKDGKNYNVWIDSDQEGNSCGSVMIEEVK